MERLPVKDYEHYQESVQRLFCIFTTEQQQVLKNKDMYQHLYDSLSSSRLDGSYSVVVSKVVSFLRHSGGEDRVIFFNPQQCPSKIDLPFSCPLLWSSLPFLPPLSLRLSFCAFHHRAIFFWVFPLFFPSPSLLGPNTNKNKTSAIKASMSTNNRSSHLLSFPQPSFSPYSNDRLPQKHKWIHFPMLIFLFFFLLFFPVRS